MKIAANIKISDLVEKYPSVVDYLVNEYQFHCVSCFVSGYEELVDGARVHSIEGRDFEVMLEEINNIADGHTVNTKSESKTPEIKLAIINIPGLLLSGAGVSDNLAMMEAIQTKHSLSPDKYIEAFNNLLPVYQRGELTQLDFWEMINEHHKTSIDVNTNWFGNYFLPQINKAMLEKILTLKKDVRVVGVISLGAEQITKAQQIIKDIDPFARIYRSDFMHSTKDEYRFWQQVLAFEGASPATAALYDKDKRSREVASKLGINVAGKFE